MPESAAVGRAAGSSPSARLDDNLSSPLCFLVMMALDCDVEFDIATLADVLEVGDPALGEAVSQLIGIGYVFPRRRAEDGLTRTWVRVTAKGQRAFQAHLAALREIAEERFPSRSLS